MPQTHTDTQFEAELRNLRDRLLLMGGKVEDMIAGASRSLVDGNSQLALDIIRKDGDIDRLEMEIDQLCLDILARRQPAARDLRFLTLAFKIVVDLERIGDECKNVAERAIELNELPRLKPLIDLPRMAQISAEMVHEALDAFVRGDDQRAIAVTRRDDEVDELNLQIFRELISYMVEDPKTITRATALIAVAKYFERVADHATNIAEMVVFMVQGRDIRHYASRRDVESR